MANPPDPRANPLERIREEISLERRRAFIAAFRRAVAHHAEALCALIRDEVGKPTHEALLADIAPLLASCRWHERNMRRILRPHRVRGAGVFGLGQRHAVMRAPLGRVAIIATWNYPVQLLGIQIVQAIAGGNRVVVKPSERSPRTHLALLRLAASCGLPPGTITWTEPTREAGQALLISDRFDHIVFTGSTSVGREIAEIAASTLTPTTLELSGRDSAIVLADADPRLAAKAIWNAVTMNAGQTCMAPRRVLVESAIEPAFIDALAPLAAAARPLTLIDDAAATRCFDLARGAIAAGGRSLSAVVESPRGREMRPLAIVDCPPDVELVNGDHFGPILAIVRVRDEVEALRIHHRCGQHLATSIFSRSAGRIRRLTQSLEATTVTVNDAVLPTAHPATSIGGRGESGWGISRGREGLLAMTRPLFASTTSSWLRPPIDVPTPTMRGRMMRFLRWMYGGASVDLPTIDGSVDCSCDGENARSTRAASAGDQTGDQSRLGIGQQRGQNAPTDWSPHSQPISSPASSPASRPTSSPTSRSTPESA